MWKNGLLTEENIKNNLISFHYFHTLYYPIEKQYPLEQELKDMLPLQFDLVGDWEQVYAKIFEKDSDLTDWNKTGDYTYLYDDCYFTVTTESGECPQLCDQFGHNVELNDHFRPYHHEMFITEKTTRPMLYLHPQILYSTSGTLEYLKECGFKTFSNYWSEDYDNEENGDKKVQMIMDVVKELNNKSLEELHEMYWDMMPLYVAFVVMLGMLIAFETKASEIEEVIVVAQQERETKAEPVEDESIISIIMPAFTYPQGGPGGFVGYAERGAQTIHTSVFVNGIPANDPGAGWYDFGHDIAHGQTVKVISGSNSVLYGSGSMAGTVLIQDTIEHGITLKRGNDDYTRVAPIDQFEVSSYKGSIGSVRNDNDEKDQYVNKTARLNVDVGDFTIVGKFSEYEYDYDNCYDYNWGQSNDCLQDGKRYNVAIRNEYFTIGRNYNTADYFTVEDPTYSNESFRDFVRFGQNMNLSQNLSVAFGVDAEKIYYNTNSWQNVEGSTEIETELTEPSIYYDEELDTNKIRPLWDGGFIGTGEFVTSTVGDGVYTLTEIQEKHSDENVGLYFSANASFVFCIRLQLWY